MGLAGPRRPFNVVEVMVEGTIVRGVVERVNDTVLVTTRESQRSAPLNGRAPEAVARDLIHAWYGGGSEDAGDIRSAAARA